MVRRPERWLAPATRLHRQARNGMHAGNFHGRGIIERGQNAGKPAGQHAFAGARRAEEQKVMATGCGHFQRSPGYLLAPDIRQVGAGIRPLRLRIFCPGHRYQPRPARQMLAHRQQVTGRQHIAVTGQRGFIGIALGQEQ